MNSFRQLGRRHPMNRNETMDPIIVKEKDRMRILGKAFGVFRLF